jgi:hypothetical protein
LRILTHQESFPIVAEKWQGLYLEHVVQCSRRLDDSTRLAESAHINRKCSASMGFHVQFWGFNATFNLRVESCPPQKARDPTGDGAGGANRGTCRPRPCTSHCRLQLSWRRVSVAEFSSGVTFPARDFKTSASLGTKFRTSKVSFGSHTTNRISNVLMTSFLRARRIVGTRAETRETNRLAT